MNANPSSLYLHIPFCSRKCAYCDFVSYSGMEHLFQSYVDALKSEIRLYAGLYPSAGISTIYFGGGTPNMLPPEMLADLLQEIKANFKVELTAEITTEANPGVSDSKESFALLVSAAGFNRLSLGFQSLHDNELWALGRIHSSREAVDAFYSARSAGFSNISIDLMYGIPGQSIDSWQMTLDMVLGLRPEHISLYSLTVECGTPFYEMTQAGKLELPGNDVEADMYETAIDVLGRAGYNHYEISNFALSGYECRHNLTYWHNRPYFGFGAGAASYLEGVRSSNASLIEEYIALVQNGEKPTASSECLSERGSMGETMFLGLRMKQGVSIGAFEIRYGVSPLTVFDEEINRLCKQELIRIEGDFIKLTSAGLLLANIVFEEFVT